MKKSKRAQLTVLVAVIGVLSIVIATGAFAAPAKHHHAHPNRHSKRTGAQLIDASLAPSQTNDPTLHGVSAGVKPWVLQRGTVLLTRGGKLDLHVKGLLIPGMGTSPVKTISASLYCGADTTAAAADSTQQAPLSSKGDAVIHDTSFKVPSTCLAPVILVHPNGDISSYIAVSGWRS